MTLDTDGWTLLPGLVPAQTIDALLEALRPPLDAGNPAGVRNLLDLPRIRELARSAGVRSAVEAALGPTAVAVRGLLFDKTPGANWKVPWHQDLTVAVRERRDVAGYDAWTEKAGVPHVHPPTDVLRAMVTARVHLDPCGPDNGPLVVLPGSHVAGRLKADDLAAWVGRTTPVACLADRGDAVFFRPLLLHSSSPAASPSHRRVVQLEFAAGPLPGDLEWRWAV